MVEPAARRAVVGFWKETYPVSERRACRLLSFSRTVHRYKPRPNPMNEMLRQKLRELAERKRRYGSPRLYWLIRREGIVVNHKRIEKLYREEGLSLRLKRRRKRATQLRIVHPVPERANERWSIDFVHDGLFYGRRFRCLTIVDDCSRESPAIEADFSLTGRRVIQVLERLEITHGLPKTLVMDNGPEFQSKALDDWAYRKGIQLHFIRPGKPVDNAFIESFNGKFRDECLNENWFLNLEEARQRIEAWRKEYNEERPHRALGGRTPHEFAQEQKNMLTGSGI